MALFGHIFCEDAQFCEMYAESIFRFLVFEVYSIFQSKTIQSLGAEPPAGGEAPPQTGGGGGFRGQSPYIYFFLP